ncbi:MAG TPA: hypothetical protein VJW23_09995 [Propionibacteriaceae bacterium]|nr:hypothetical protein [Propionibacteriaceae bacterium]
MSLPPTTPRQYVNSFTVFDDTRKLYAGLAQKHRALGQPELAAMLQRYADKSERKALEILVQAGTDAQRQLDETGDDA